MTNEQPLANGLVSSFLTITRRRPAAYLSRVTPALAGGLACPDCLLRPVQIPALGFP